ncbi:MBL fold metallo-hydrolase [Thermodesulfobacteriota bacterium]
MFFRKSGGKPYRRVYGNDQKQKIKGQDMVVDQPGNVSARIRLLGRKDSCVYLLDGKDEYALLGGGMVTIVPEVIQQLEAYRIDEKKIKRIVILHSHFDHCGIVPFFKRRWPWIRVMASQRAKELLADAKVNKTIESLNRMLITGEGLDAVAADLGYEFSGIMVDTVVKGNELIPCGDLSMEVIEVPGHSSCSIAIYVQKEKALFASDAGGIPFGRRIFTAANSNFDRYQESLEKMSKFNTEIYLAEHFGALIGEDCRGFFEKSMASAAQTRKLLEASLAHTGSVEKSTEEITAKMTAGITDGLLPKELIAMVIGQMLSYLYKQQRQN